jgi:predicted nucleic acid-binding protein
MNLMLDTYAIIELFRGSEKGVEVKNFLEKDNYVSISVLSLYETGTVLEREIGKKRTKKYLRSIQTYYNIIDVNKEITLMAVELRRNFKLPSIDCLIYATSRSIKSKLITGCKHFKEISKQRDILII